MEVSFEERLMMEIEEEKEVGQRKEEKSFFSIFKLQQSTRTERKCSRNERESNTREGWKEKRKERKILVVGK